MKVRRRGWLRGEETRFYLSRSDSGGWWSLCREDVPVAGVDCALSTTTVQRLSWCWSQMLLWDIMPVVVTDLKHCPFPEDSVTGSYLRCNVSLSLHNCFVLGSFISPFYRRK